MKNERMRILLVDDDEAYLRVTKRILQSEFEIFVASTAHDALEVLRTTKIDVIVSDVEMPDVDGIALLRIVARTHPSVLRVLLSGYQPTAAESVAAINEAEVVRFLSKSQEHEDISGVLRSLEPRVEEARSADDLATRARKNAAARAWVERHYPGTLRIHRDDEGWIAIDARALVCALERTTWRESVDLLAGS